MYRKRRTRKRAVREIHYFISLALKPDTPLVYADRYVELARKLGMRARVSIPRGLKLFICRRCKRVLKPGLTGIYRVRSRPKKSVSVKCLRCGYTHRYVYSYEPEKIGES
jgi:ribonuclease P protein subunit RPR2